MHDDCTVFHLQNIGNMVTSKYIHDFGNVVIANKYAG